MKSKKKKTKRKLAVRFAVYIISSAVLLVGLVLYLKGSLVIPEFYRKSNTGSAEGFLSPVILRMEILARNALREGAKIRDDSQQDLEKLDMEAIEEAFKEACKEGEIDQCFANLRDLKGSKKFEPIGGYTITDESKKVLEDLFSIFEKRGCAMGFIVLDLRSGKGVAYNCDEEFFSASSVKGPYMVSLIANEPQSFIDYRRYFDGIAATSDNGCYNALFRLYGNEYFNKWCEEAGIDLRMDSDYNYVSYSPRQLASLWLQNYRFFTTDKDNGLNAAMLFDHPSYSTINKSLGEYYATLTKSGWIDLRYQSMIDSGIVQAGAYPYLITLMTSYGGDLWELNAITYEFEKIHADITDTKSRLTDEYIEKKRKEYSIGYWW